MQEQKAITLWQQTTLKWFLSLPLGTITSDCLRPCAFGHCLSPQTQLFRQANLISLDTWRREVRLAFPLRPQQVVWLAQYIVYRATSHPWHKLKHHCSLGTDMWQSSRQVMGITSMAVIKLFQPDAHQALRSFILCISFGVSRQQDWLFPWLLLYTSQIQAISLLQLLKQTSQTLGHHLVFSVLFPTCIMGKYSLFLKVLWAYNLLTTLRHKRIMAMRDIQVLSQTRNHVHES